MQNSANPKFKNNATQPARRTRRRLARALCALVTVNVLGLCAATAAEALMTRGNGTYLTSKLRPISFQIPANFDPQYIVGAGMDSNDSLILWFQDGNLIGGPLDKYYSPNVMGGPYKLTKHTPTQIVGMAIGNNDLVYTWFNDNTYSIGNLADLEANSSGNAYYMPKGKRVEQIVDIAMTNSAQKTTATYFTDGEVYHGEPGNLGAFGYQGSVSLSDNLTPWTMLAVAQGGSTDVHAWHLKPYGQPPQNGWITQPPQNGWPQPPVNWPFGKNNGGSQNNGNWNQSNGSWPPPQNQNQNQNGKGFWFGPNGFGFTDGNGNSVNLKF